MMQGANGFDLLCQICKLRNSPAVLMISAYESIDLVQQCILSGADAYLLKPLRLQELRNIWQFVWRRRHEVMLQQHHSRLQPTPIQPSAAESSSVVDRARRMTRGRQQLRTA